MLLTPHHFQQWDNYYEELLTSRVRSILPFEYGVLDLQINREAITLNVEDAASLQVTKAALSG